MNREEVFERVEEICRDIFEDDGLTVTDDTTAADVAKWDSLTHLTFVNELEEEFDVTFTLDEVTGSSNLGELIDALMRHIEER